PDSRAQSPRGSRRPGGPRAGALARRPGGPARRRRGRGPRAGPVDLPARGGVPRPHRCRADGGPMSTTLARCYRFELVKLLAQGRIRLVLLVSLLAPGAFVAAISTQSSLPTDTVFGRWMNAGGWAGSLVVLA